MESLPQAEQHEAEEQQLEASKMAQLASQARLSQLQLQTGLAAARRQRIVSAKCCVPVVTAAGGEAMAQLSDIAESDEVGLKTFFVVHELMLAPKLVVASHRQWVRTRD